MHLSAYLVFCLFAWVLSFIRVLTVWTTDLLGLLWNLILALLPYLFALGFISVKNKSRWILFLLWFFFLPNSFYILTDFVHLRRFPDMVYFDTVYISAMTFAGMISGFASIELIHREWNIHFHKKIAWILVVLTMTISIIWVFIGRFLRFNSWDIISDPLDLIREIGYLLISNGRLWDISDSARVTESQLFEVGAMGLWQFTLLYTSFFLLIYVYVYHVKGK